jgi:hypothetical protein
VVRADPLLDHVALEVALAVVLVKQQTRRLLIEGFFLTDLSDNQVEMLAAEPAELYRMRIEQILVNAMLPPRRANVRACLEPA